jgi:hypothetical protein
MSEKDIEKNNETNSTAKEIKIHNRNRHISIKQNNSKKLNENNNYLESENRLLAIKNQMNKKDSKNTKDFIKKEESINENENENFNNINLNQQNIEDKSCKTNQKGFLQRSLDWLNYYYHEIPLLWKSEELVEGFDANGNIIKRPKNKIPYKENQNNIDINDQKDNNQANLNGANYAKDGIYYGVYFNNV